MTYRVLVVEDEPIAAEAHAAYVNRLDGFRVAGTAGTARAAVAFLAAADDVDLVLLDMHLPDGHGLGILRHLRSSGQMTDVIAVTSARDVEIVKHAVAQGVVGYLIKPFTFSGFRAKLDDYAAYRQRLAGQHALLDQADVDAMLTALRPARLDQVLPKGLTASTLALVTKTLREAPGPVSAAQLAAIIGASRVTARRYLEHLADIGSATRHNRLGGTGRPEIEYGWASH